MCFVIDSENVLANYFFHHSDKNKVTISELKNIRNKIEEKLKLKVYVDITSDSLVSATHTNNFFSWEGIYIKRRSSVNKSFFKKIEDNYNWRLPQSIKADYIKVIETL